jgi:hypothetical protein
LHSPKSDSAISERQVRRDARSGCGVADPEALADHGAIVFMTTGEIPLPTPTRDALFRRLRAGGGLVGIHCATDTYYKVSAWADMIGGVFAGHPWTQRVRLRVEQPAHPIGAPFAKDAEIDEEIYQFKNFRRAPLDVALSLDTGSVDATKGQRTDGDYALAWTRAWARGACSTPPSAMGPPHGTTRGFSHISSTGSTGRSTRAKISPHPSRGRGGGRPRRRTALREWTLRSLVHDWRNPPRLHEARGEGRRHVPSLRASTPRPL